MAAPHLPPTAVPQALHDGVDFRLKHLSQLGAVLVDPRRLSVVQPGVVEHQPHVLNVLPRLLVLSCVQLPLNGGQIHGVLHDVKVVLDRKGVPSQIGVKDWGKVQELREARGGRTGRMVIRGEKWRKVGQKGEVKAPQSAGWDQSRERRGCRGTVLLSAAEKKVHVQTERHDNVCPLALCFAPETNIKASVWAGRETF